MEKGRAGGRRHPHRAPARDGGPAPPSSSGVAGGAAPPADLFQRGDAPFDQEEFSRARAEVVAVAPDRRVLVKSAEDTLLRKLHWYRLGGERSDRQWSDVEGLVRTQGNRLDRAYLERWAVAIGVADLLARVLE